MKVATTAQRFQEYMDIYDLRQIDIVMKCLPYFRKHDMKMSKGIFGHYYKGDRIPKHDKLEVFAEALHVSVAWLDGYDVPMYPTSSEEFSADDAIILADVAFDDKLMHCIRQIKELSDPSKLKVYGYVEGLHDAETTP